MGIIAALAMEAAALVGVVAFALNGGGIEYSLGNDQTPEIPSATAEIIRTEWMQSTTVAGHLDYAGRRIVKAAASGTVTEAPVEGKSVTAGHVLYELDAKPVVLLYGTTPMFRDMKVGASGPDVLQLKRDLRALGYGSSTTISSTYDQATKATVESWQRSLGMHDPSGEIEKGDIVFQPGAVHVVSADATSGSHVSPGKEVAAIASTTPVVQAQLDKDQRDLTTVGARVEVALPDSRPTWGEVSETINPKTRGGATNGPPDGPGSGGTQRVQVEITLDAGFDPPPAEFTETSSVTITTESCKGVLTVPVDAIVALPGGGYGLQIVADDTTTLVRVELGTSTGDRIEVSGDGLFEGMTVGVGQE